MDISRIKKKVCPISSKICRAPNTECNFRTAFTIFLLDAMRTVFFGERPNLNAYDVRLRLPCHENVFRATNSTDWKGAMPLCADLTTFQFPIVISSLLSITATDCLGLYSVMGSFIVLHGKNLSRMQQFKD